MAASFSAAELAALENDSASLNIGIVYKVRTTPSINLFFGIGDINPGVNAVDTVGETYNGAGALINVQPFQQVINGGAESATFVLSGVNQKVIDIAETHANKLLNVECWYGYLLMDQQWQQIGPIHWLWMMLGDYVTTDQRASDGITGPVIRTVSFSMRDQLAARRRARNSYWIDPDQQFYHPGDRICERGILNSMSIAKKWPPT